MKNKFKKTVLPILAFALCMFSFSSCETTDSFTCPYLISNPHIELGKVEEKYILVFSMTARRPWSDLPSHLCFTMQTETILLSDRTA